MPRVIVSLGNTFGMAENGIVYALHGADKAKVVDYIGNDKKVVIANVVVVKGKEYDVVFMEEDVSKKLSKLHM